MRRGRKATSFNFQETVGFWTTLRKQFPKYFYHSAWRHAEGHEWHGKGMKCILNNVSTAIVQAPSHCVPPCNGCFAEGNQRGSWNDSGGEGDALFSTHGERMAADTVWWVWGGRGCVTPSSRPAAKPGGHGLQLFCSLEVRSWASTWVLCVSVFLFVQRGLKHLLRRIILKFKWDNT